MFRLLGCLVLVAGLAACGPRLSRGLLAEHPPLHLEVERPRVTTASSEQRPSWLRERRSGGTDVVSFVGQGSAVTREAAQRDATRDLFEAVGRYVSTDVQSEFEATETLRQRDGDTSGSFSARSEVHTQAGDTVERIRPAGVYWERVESPGQSATFHYYVHALVPRADIERSAQLAALGAGALVVVLPFVSPRAGEGEALRAQLADRLSPLSGYAVCPWTLVQPILAGEPQLDLDAVRDQLSPRLVVTGQVTRSNGRVQVNYVVSDGSAEAVYGHGRLARPATELFELQDELVAAVARDVATALRRGEADR